MNDGPIADSGAYLAIAIGGQLADPPDRTTKRRKIRLVLPQFLADLLSR